MSRFFGLGIWMFFFFRFHSENRQIIQNILNYVKEYFSYPIYATAIGISMDKRIRIINRILKSLVTLHN